MTSGHDTRVLSVDAALERVLESVVPAAVVEVPLADAHGRVLAEDLVAADPLPSFRSSAMDGFAIRSADSAAASADQPVRLAVVGESRAGHPFEGALGEETCVRISTGAAVPANADAVIRIEEVEAGDSEIALSALVEAGNDVRPIGDDVAGGQRMLAAGTVIGGPELGALAALAQPVVAVQARPTVALLVTGDELLAPEEPARAGAIRNSNGPMLTGLAREAGAEVRSVKHVGDDREATIAAIRRGLEADLLVISGGVSVGAHDHVKPALEAAGVEQGFWRVALRPGHPTWFGVAGGSEARTLVFGLPGNPVSAAVTFDLFVRPALAAMEGRPAARLTVDATLEERYVKHPGRAHYLRLRAALRDGRWYVRPTGAQGSHRLSSLLGVDAIALIDADAGPVEAGAAISVQLLPHVLSPDA